MHLHFSNITEQRVYFSYDALKPFPAKNFILIEFQLPYFKSVLFKLKSSIWWNLSGLYIIQNVENPDTCKDAYSYLRIVWEFSILRSVFICRNSNSTKNLYTFNPFNHQSTNTWEIEKLYKQENGHDFALFKYVHKLKGKNRFYLHDILLNVVLRIFMTSENYILHRKLV